MVKVIPEENDVIDRLDDELGIVINVKSNPMPPLSQINKGLFGRLLWKYGVVKDRIKRFL